MVVTAGTAEVSEKGRRRAIGVLLTGVAVIVLYWLAWLVERSLLASDTRPAYFEFEAAFVLADAWLAACMAAAARALAGHRPTALLWLLAGGGAGGYLAAKDVLYNLQHGIWFAGPRGPLELAVNLATVALSLGMLAWAWPRRAALLDGR
jgi:hypothetical protein